MYSVSIVVWREVYKQSEEVSLKYGVQASVVYTVTKMAHVSTTTFAFNPGGAIRRAEASAKEAWPRDEGWGEPHISVTEIPIPEKIATQAFRSGWDAVE